MTTPELRVSHQIRKTDAVEAVMAKCSDNSCSRAVSHTERLTSGETPTDTQVLELIEKAESDCCKNISANNADYPKCPDVDKKPCICAPTLTCSALPWPAHGGMSTYIPGHADWANRALILQSTYTVKAGFRTFSQTVTDVTVLCSHNAVCVDPGEIRTRHPEDLPDDERTESPREPFDDSGRQGGDYAPAPAPRLDLLDSQDTGILIDTESDGAVGWQSVGRGGRSTSNVAVGTSSSSPRHAQPAQARCGCDVATGQCGCA